MNIAIDYGGVCSESVNYDVKSNKPVELAKINIPDCVESLIALKQLGHKIYLISFAGRRRSEMTKEYLDKEHPRLFDDIFFVRDPTYKNDICQHIGAHIMVDDRNDVLNTIHHVHKIMFNNGTNEYFTKHYKGNVANGWKEVVEQVKVTKLKNRVPKPVNLSSICYLREYEPPIELKVEIPLPNFDSNVEFPALGHK